MIDQEVRARPVPPPPARGPARRRAVIALAVLGCAGGGLVLLVQLLCAVAVGLAALPGPTAPAHPQRSQAQRSQAAGPPVLPVSAQRAQTGLHLGRTGDWRAPSTAHAQPPGA